LTSSGLIELEIWAPAAGDTASSVPSFTSPPVVYRRDNIFCFRIFFGNAESRRNTTYAFDVLEGNYLKVTRQYLRQTWAEWSWKKSHIRLLQNRQI